MSILSFHGVCLNLAGKQILDQVDWSIQAHDRIGLVGRNGAGKSTLMKVLQGEVAPDQGVIQQQSQLTVAGLTQAVPLSADETVYHFLVKELGPIGEALNQFHLASTAGNLNKMAQYQQQIEQLQAWDKLPKIESMASRLGLDPAASMRSLSGGMKRRVLLAAALIASPDLLLLDEPTNHLDMDSIEWLESYLKNYVGSVLVVTHDRTFLSQVACQIVEIDRGQLFTYNCRYETYLERRDARLQSDAKQHALFDKRLSQEETWLRTGVKARRTRNEGRVRALKAMREAYQQRRKEVGRVQSRSIEAIRSGRLILEATEVNYAIGQNVFIHDFSLLLTRGDKVGIIGPNGCGKTTLVRLLLGEIAPSSGHIRLSDSLTIAYFDQLRRHLDERQTVMANVADGSDFVTIQGQQKHVASYLGDFLFSPETLNQPVSCLSGGERNRLLLAKLFAKPFNLLVMDEPTNDLDLETLELLESMLLDYQGTLLLISHDRAFINQVVTSILVYEGQGRFVESVGGYDAYRAGQKQRLVLDSSPQKRTAEPRIKPDKLSYHEQRELAQLPRRIELSEQQVEQLQLEMADPSFYRKNGDEIIRAQQGLADEEKLLAQLYERWEQLETKKG